ncbi:MAG: IPT/TIG domain-containing protein [Chitinophagaceae bacterium]|nr:IPT/TIG domain-containing protein [Chitinophagaceae bacterium]
MRHLLLLTITVITFFSCKKSSETPVVINSVTPMKDGAGAPVTILGTGFGTDSAACTVLFSGKPATIESFSDTKLIVRVPSNATNGKIEVRVKSQSVFTANDFILLSGIWNRKSDFPGDGRANLVSFTIGNKAYVGLGDSNGPFYNDLYEYDASTNSWTKKANLPGPGLNRATAVAAGGKGYIICGTEPGSIIKNDLWEYNPSSNAWTKKADFPGSRTFLCCWIFNKR